MPILRPLEQLRITVCLVYSLVGVSFDEAAGFLDEGSRYSRWSVPKLGAYGSFSEDLLVVGIHFPHRISHSSTPDISSTKQRLSSLVSYLQTLYNAESFIWTDFIKLTNCICLWRERDRQTRKERVICSVCVLFAAFDYLPLKVRAYSFGSYHLIYPFVGFKSLILGFHWFAFVGI